MDTKFFIAVIAAIAFIAVIALIFFKPQQQEVLPSPEIVTDNNTNIELPETIQSENQSENISGQEQNNAEEVPNIDTVINNSSDIDLPENI